MINGVHFPAGAVDDATKAQQLQPGLPLAFMRAGYVLQYDSDNEGKPLTFECYKYELFDGPHESLVLQKPADEQAMKVKHAVSAAEGVMHFTYNFSFYVRE